MPGSFVEHRGEEVRKQCQKDIYLAKQERIYLCGNFSFLQPFTGGEGQIVSLGAEKRYFNIQAEGQSSLTKAMNSNTNVKGTDPTWSQNWLSPGTVPLLGTCAIWGQYPVLSRPESSQGAPPLKARLPSPNGCGILCFLMWQVAFLVHTRSYSNPAVFRKYSYCGF